MPILALGPNEYYIEERRLLGKVKGKARGLSFHHNLKASNFRYTRTVAIQSLLCTKYLVDAHIIIAKPMR